jgi:hypothetical protein
MGGNSMHLTIFRIVVKFCLPFSFDIFCPKPAVNCPPDRFMAMASTNMIRVGIVGITGLEGLLGCKEALLGFSQCDRLA